MPFGTVSTERFMRTLGGLPGTAGMPPYGGNTCPPDVQTTLDGLEDALRVPPTDGFSNYVSRPKTMDNSDVDGPTKISRLQ